MFAKENNIAFDLGPEKKILCCILWYGIFVVFLRSYEKDICVFVGSCIVCNL